MLKKIVREVVEEVLAEMLEGEDIQELSKNTLRNLHIQSFR